MVEAVDGGGGGRALRPAKNGEEIHCGLAARIDLFKYFGSYYGQRIIAV